MFNVTVLSFVLSTSMMGNLNSTRDDIGWQQIDSIEISYECASYETCKLFEDAIVASNEGDQTVDHYTITGSFVEDF
jgi:hypothetical protein